jgi:UDP-N-acetylglucosamine 2-epimerase (non-hydrolysing)
MPTSRRIAVIFGTRPEAIKLAPVVLALREAGAPHVVVTTGQHADLVGDVLEPFGITPDVDLGLMREEQGLDYVLAAAIGVVGRELDRLVPSVVVVQGDTTSMLGSALAAFHRGIPVAHVEAGLRSDDMALPFPEEMNRRVASVLASWHFAPTDRAAENLRASGVREGIHVVGNTGVDAVRHVTSAADAPLPPELGDFLGEAPYVLATAHRRESWGAGIAAVAAGLRGALDDLPDHRLLFVTHPNPSARRPVEEALAGHERALVSDALPYATFLRLLRGARLAVSDSGGIQEEGPTLGVPVLVTREVTERPEGVAAGAVRLIGTDTGAVRDAVVSLLGAAPDLAAMAHAGRGLYGDGYAAGRIVRAIVDA